MKRLLKYIVFICLFIIPFKANAKAGIDNYYIDLDVMSNGDVKVKELFVLNGEYNGYKRIINFKNSSARVFTGATDDFNGSDIYNGDGIEIIAVKGIEVDSNINFDYLNHDGTYFNEVSYAYTGDYGVYEKTDTSDGTELKIYNPDSYSNGFYIEYIIKNMGVVHNDVAEVGFNLFSDLQTEYINDLEMYINIPGNEDELRAWGHGPLWGETENINKEKIKLTIKDLEAKTAVDVRFVFDKEVLSLSGKKTNVDALDKILEVEKVKADEANELREKYKNQKRIFKLILIGAIVLYIGWFVGLIIMIIYVYNKHDKEYKSDFMGKYFRDFPSDMGPEIVGYLMNKKIGDNELSASILNLIYKKKIEFEKKDEKDFKLKLIDDKELNESDAKLIRFLFDEKTEITLSEIKKNAKESYNSFLVGYNGWKTTARLEAEKMNFFEDKKKAKTLCCVYCSVGILIGLATFPIGIPMFILAIIGIIYFSKFYKRTREGNNEYRKWLGLKNFMEDFGNFKEKDLPEISLWEKYLVYAVVFGCASKLAKTMEIKVKEMANIEGYNYDPIYDYNRIHFVTTFNREINRSINLAVASANAERIAESSSSSSGGFGGGFSSGGGSFGGGGGGGRF